MTELAVTAPSATLCADDRASEALATLQSRIADAGEAHAEGAAKRTEDPVLRRLFEDLHALYQQHAAALAAALAARGVAPGADGSFLKYVQKTVLNMRSAVGALDVSAIPTVREGETRMLGLYDEAIRDVGADAGLADLLERQRDELAGKIQEMKTLESDAAR